jgi:hypothetical protein
LSRKRMRRKASKAKTPSWKPVRTCELLGQSNASI